MDQSIDKSNLRRVILTTADQFAEGFAAAKNINVDSNFSRIMVSGMGGSALPANVLRIYVNNITDKYSDYGKLDIFQNRFYKLPPEAYEDCLNIISSHSGNTEETIASFEEALENNLPCVGISSGGRVEEICKENNVPHVKLPIPYENFQPRTATGHVVSAFIQLLVNAGKLPDSVVDMSEMVENLQKSIESTEQQGKEIAQKLKGKTPVVYASTKFKSLAMIWKIKINENAKTPAFWNYFPELNHNEFVGFTNTQAKFRVLMLRDDKDHERNLLRYDVTAKFLEEKGVETEIIDMPEGDDVLYQSFATIALGDWVSYYLALEYEQDPTPVDMVEDLKKALK